MIKARKKDSKLFTLVDAFRWNIKLKFVSSSPSSFSSSIKGQEEEKKRQIAHEYSEKDDAMRILKQSIKGVISRKTSMEMH